MQDKSKNDSADQPRDLDEGLEKLVKTVSNAPWIVGGVFALLVIAYIVAFISNGWAKSPDSWGQLGDYIGGLLNPLVAGFALLALVASVKLQRQELAATREELRASKIAVEEQAKTLEQQRQEQRFFDFLQIYRNTVESVSFEVRHTDMMTRLRYPDRPEPAPSLYSGKRAFLYLISSRQSSLQRIQSIFEPSDSGKNQTDTEQQSPTESEITSAWAEESQLLDHYFRIVFTLLREAENILKTEHFRYIKLFRAQLSRDEVSLITLNIMYDEEGKRMRNLVAKYGLLKHLPESPLREHASLALSPFSFGLKRAAQEKGA